jgi:hypothetical protein
MVGLLCAGLDSLFGGGGHVAALCGFTSLAVSVSDVFGFSLDCYWSNSDNHGDAAMFRSRRLSACLPLLRVTSSAPLARGATGPAVATMQDLLNDLGFSFVKSFKNGQWDGIFGSETDANVRKFQLQKRLASDGMIGPKTLGLFDELILADPLLELPDFGKYKAGQAFDRVLPAEQRGNMYW